MREPALRNKIEGRINYDAEKDYAKIFEWSFDDEGWLM